MDPAVNGPDAETERRRRAGIIDAFLAAHPDIRRFEIFAHDLSGRPRGKRHVTRSARRIFVDGTRVANSNFLLDASGAVTNAAGSGFDDGDPDVRAYAVPESLRPVPWAATPTAEFQLTAIAGQDGVPDLDPRIHAARALAAFRERGWHPVVAFELEFHLFAPRLGRDGRPLAPRAPVGGRREDDHQVYDMEQLAEFEPVVEDILRAAEIQELPITVASIEYGRGQFETNLAHRDDPLRAADEALALRRLVRGVAARHGLKASFMAKPLLDDAGSGMHVHLSLLDRNGRALFHAPDGPSRTLRHAIAGLLETMPSLLALFAPNRNAFRRFVPDLFVPVAANWGIDNRSTAVRVIMGNAGEQRLEHRVASADAHPHLVLLALLAGVWQGLARRMEPPPPVTGNAGGRAAAWLATGLRGALDRLERALETQALDAPFLDRDWLAAVVQAKRTELERLETEEIPPHEYRWYL